MVNKSGLKPLGRAVLVEPYEPEMAHSMIKIPDFVKQNYALADARCRIIELGEHCWHDEKGPRAKVGDLVMVTKFAGFMSVGPADGKQYRLVNDRDIFCQITQEVKLKKESPFNLSKSKKEGKVANG